MADTPSATTSRRRKNIDGGWAYLILIAAHICYFLFAGTGKMLGVMLPTLKEQFNTHTWLLGSIISVRSAIKDASAIPAALLSRKWSTRWIILGSSIITSCGVIFASLAQTVTQFAIFVSVFTGIGFGFSIPLLQTTLGYYFRKKYACATGLSTSGISLGTIVMAPLTQLLLDEYGWRGTFLVIGGISLNLVALGGLVQPLVSSKKVAEEILAASDRSLSQNDNGNAVQGERTKRRRSSLRSLAYRPVTTINVGVKKFAKSSDISLFKKLSFVIVLVISCILRFVMTAWIIYFVPHALDMKFGKYDASFGVTVFGVGNLLGRIFIGPLVDRKIITGRMTLFLSTSLTSVVLFCDCMMTTVAAMIVGTFLLGVGLGIANCMYVVVNRKVVGIDRLANSIGWTSIVSGLVRIPAGFFPGWIYDHTGSYNNVFFILASVAALCPLLIILEAVIYRFFRKRVPAASRWECVLTDGN